MGNKKPTTFGPFRLDLPNECLWKGTQVLKLRPKAFGVLEYLLGRPGQLVTKEDLLSAVWPETFVGEAVLKVAIREIREVLGDDPAAPRFIETAHRRGYRFIGPVEAHVEPEAGSPNERAVSGSPLQDRDALQRVVGRDGILSRMQMWLEKATAGQRQIVFVTGEAGIGKTSVVDRFTRTIGERGIRVGRGQCLEQYGTGEAYLPVLEAIGRLCREQQKLVDLLRLHAPMWLLQLPSLVSASDRQSLSREVSGATRERMLREMVEALEILTAEQPLVLILEDLHWSDYSTLDLISYLARQRHPAKLMVIGTYRTVELIVSGHPLKAVKQELLAKGKCVELPLEYLSKEAVSRYLAVRFPTNRFPGQLATMIHERTEGSPLFMVNAVNYLVAEGSIVDHGGVWELAGGVDKVVVGVPDSIKQMIAKQIDHLDGVQQRTLEAASVAGVEFSAMAVAVGLDEEATDVEASFDGLARQRQFIQDRGVQELPNGEAIPRYGFIHALYQNVLYERLSTSRRVQLHRRIGEQEEMLYGDRAMEMAAELAMHFERGANYKRSADYFHHAAENALRRFAYREAAGLSRRGLEVLGRLPDTSERAAHELRLHITLGVSLIATEGYAAEPVGSTYRRARELCRKLREPTETSQVLWGLWTFYLVRAELETARSIAAEFWRLFPNLPYPGVAMEVTLMHLGELSPAMEHFEKALSRYDQQPQRDDAVRYSQDAGVSMQCHASWTLWLLGRPDQALARVGEALTLARSLSEPHGIAHGLFFAALLHQLRREEKSAQEYADTAIEISGQHGLALYEALCTVTGGWALSGLGQQEQAVAQIQRGLAAHEAAGMMLLRPHFLALYAEVLGRANRPADGLGVLEQALTLAGHSRERYYEAELYRLKGELILMQSAGQAVPQAEKCFHTALEIARQQHANSFELRAAISLVRLHRTLHERKDSQHVLARTYDKFAEGFDTPDLREAKGLLLANA